MDKDEIKELVKQNQLGPILEKDQLIVQKQGGSVFNDNITIYSVKTMTRAKSAEHPHGPIECYGVVEKCCKMTQTTIEMKVACCITDELNSSKVIIVQLSLLSILKYLKLTPNGGRKFSTM